jgi:hypothetical protein
MTSCQFELEFASCQLELNCCIEKLYVTEALFSSPWNAKYQLLWNDEMQNVKIFMGVFSFKMPNFSWGA